MAGQTIAPSNVRLVIDGVFMQDAAIFPITNPKTANYHASQVHNAVYGPGLQQFDPTNVWIDKDKQGG